MDFIEKMIEAGAIGLYESVCCLPFSITWTNQNEVVRNAYREKAEACLHAAFKELPTLTYEYKGKTEKDILEQSDTYEDLQKWANEQPEGE